MSTQYYKDQERFYVSVDCIILGFKESKLYLLVAKRKFSPLKGCNSLMGGFLLAGESLSQAAHRTLYEYTGIENIFMEQVGTYGDVSRDEGERVISIAYYALIDLELFDEALCNMYHASWVELGHVGRLIFDHTIMLDDTLKILRKKAAVQPIGFNLLPEKFTMPQLQNLYEAIYETSFDKRNFRKKIMEMNILEKQDDKDKSSSKRGAFYYKFNKERYDYLIQKGY